MNADHWNTPRLRVFMKTWAGITCLGTIALTAILFVNMENPSNWIQAARQSPNAVDAGFGAAFLCLSGYGWKRSKRMRKKRAIARLRRQTVLNGIDLSRSLM
jgi:hypothetical protein